MAGKVKIFRKSLVLYLIKLFINIECPFSVFERRFIDFECRFSVYERRFLLGLNTFLPRFVVFSS